MRESNSHQRFWRPLSYHLTNPLRESLTIFLYHILTGFVNLFLIQTFILPHQPLQLLQIFSGKFLVIIAVLSRDSGSQRAKQHKHQKQHRQAVAPQGIQGCNDTHCKCCQVCGNRYPYIKFKMFFSFHVRVPLFRPKQQFSLSIITHIWLILL